MFPAETPATRPLLTASHKKRQLEEYKMPLIDKSSARRLCKPPPKKYMNPSKPFPDDHLHPAEKDTTVCKKVKFLTHVLAHSYDALEIGQYDFLSNDDNALGVYKQQHEENKH